MKNLNKSPKPDFEDFREIFLKNLYILNSEANLWMTERTIQKNMKFIETCYYYNWTIHWLENYLKSKEYILHSNFWKASDFEKEFRKEIDNIKSWVYLIWYYFWENMEVKRYLFWWKSWAVKILQKKLSWILESILNPIPNWI